MLIHHGVFGERAAAVTHTRPPSRVGQRRRRALVGADAVADALEVVLGERALDLYQPYWA